LPAGGFTGAVPEFDLLPGYIERAFEDLERAIKKRQRTRDAGAI
jgi:hypothetical protein